MKKIIIIFFAFVFSTTEVLANCKSDDISKLYEMIYAPLVPFQAPVDDEGNIAVSPEELYVLRSQHFFDQLKNNDTITIPLETYAVLSREVPDALVDFETKLRLLLPDCQEIAMYRGSPIGELNTSFQNIIKIAKIGIKSDLEQIVEFASESLNPLPMEFNQVMKILNNDLSLDPEIISSIMPKQMIDRYFPGAVVPIANLSEAALLTFVSRGGTIEKGPKRIFLIVPKSYSGVSENYSAIIISDNGLISKTAALNVDLTAQIMSRLGIQVDILTLKKIITTNDGACEIDVAGRWFQLIGGRKVRNCPFFSMTINMLNSGTYKNTDDFIEQNTVYREVDKILKSKSIDKTSIDG